MKVERDWECDYLRTVITDGDSCSCLYRYLSIAISISTRSDRKKHPILLFILGRHSIRVQWSGSLHGTRGYIWKYTRSIDVSHYVKHCRIKEYWFTMHWWPTVLRIAQGLTTANLFILSIGLLDCIGSNNSWIRTHVKFLI